MSKLTKISERDKDRVLIHFSIIKCTVFFMYVLVEVEAILELLCHEIVFNFLFYLFIFILVCPVGREGKILKNNINLLPF